MDVPSSTLDYHLKSRDATMAFLYTKLCVPSFMLGRAGIQVGLLVCTLRPDHEKLPF